MRARWAVTLAATLTMMLAGAAGAAHATDPVSLGSSYVLDQAGVLSAAQEEEANERLGDLYAQTGVDLYAVFVDEFTNPSDSEQWAGEVAARNGLGPKQYLLAVAVDTRQYYLSADSTGPLSTQQIAEIEDSLVPPLRAGDYAGAITTAADGMQSALSGGGAGGAGGFVPGLLIFLVVAAIVALVIWLIVRRRRKAKVVDDGATTPSDLDGLDTKELARRASSALVETDDAVRTSEQELGFARAQFGDAATVDFERALQLATANLHQAFTLKQKLDDTTPDTEQEIRAWNAQILQLLGEANRELDDKAAAFDQLRKLEQNAPEALARVQEQRGAAVAEIERADAQLRTLSSSYAPQALAMVADNPEQARQRIAFADERLAAAQQAIGSDSRGEAAVSIRAAEESIGQATLLEDAIEKLAVDLAEGERNAIALIAELEQDIAAAAALPDPDGRVAGVVAATRQQLDAAKANLASTQKRPLVTLQALEAANGQIDGIVQAVRDAEANAQRARQILGQTILQAQAQVSAAEDYITSRRGAIGAEARTRLAEAGSSLVQAQQLQTTNPEQALQHAQRANQLAGQAIQHAQGDVGAFQSGGMSGGVSGGSSGGGGMLGAVLGGIVINSLLSGGGGAGRSSGRRPSSGGFGGMSAGRGGGFTPGSFGGGGTRARRGGGRF